MSGARPSAGRPVLAFPCVPAPGVRAASLTGRAGVPRAPVSASLAVPRSPPRRSPGWNEAGAPEEGAGGSRRDCSDPGAGGAEDAGPVRAGGGGGDGDGEAGGRGRCTGQPIRSARGLAPAERRAPGWPRSQGAAASPAAECGAGRVLPTRPLPDQPGETLLPPRPTRLELRQ